LAVANASEDVGAVLLNLLPAAPPVAELAAMQFTVDEFDVHGQSCGQSRQERQQRLSVRFSRSVKAKHSGNVLKQLNCEKEK
jgi:hypothetical protein